MQSGQVSQALSLGVKSMPASDRKAWIDYVCNIPFGGKRRFCQQLEKELAGFALPELVARLKPASPTVEELLGGDPQKVADAGLCELDERAILQLGRHILTRPRILLKLQRFFLEIGGPYWQELLQKEDVSMPPRVRKILEYVDVRIKQVIAIEKRKHCRLT